MTKRYTLISPTKIKGPIILERQFTEIILDAETFLKYSTGPTDYLKYSTGPKDYLRYR